MVIKIKCAECFEGRVIEENIKVQDFLSEDSIGKKYEDENNEEEVRKKIERFFSYCILL